MIHDKRQIIIASINVIPRNHPENNRVKCNILRPKLRDAQSTELIFMKDRSKEGNFEREEGRVFAYRDPSSFDDAREASANDGDMEGGTLKYEENKKGWLDGVPFLPWQQGGWNEDRMAAAPDTPRVVKSIPWF